jgi:hypothetical protein
MTLFEPYNLPFAAALGLMLTLAIAQAVGLGDAFGAEADVDIDTDLDGDAAISSGPIDGLFTLLGIGRVPFMIWLATFLLLFAALGLGIQQLAEGLTGGPLYRWLAAAFAGGAALPATAMIARPLGAIIPQDETTAVSTASLLGRRGRITDGTARAASPARARVKDIHGQTHHVMVEPHEQSSEFHSGDQILLVRREGNIFYATALANRQLSPTD